jgi:hypothetical protein
MSNAREQELLTLRELMRSENGRALMWRCLAQTGIFNNDFDVMATVNAFHSGRREQGVWLTGELKEAALDEYLMMLKEHADG